MHESDQALLRDVEKYYSKRVREHGATPKGVDWNSPESQQLRFVQLARLWDGEPGTEFGLIDYGCGYGALADFLQARGTRVRYQGLDISAPMIEKATATKRSNCTFTTNVDALGRADYVVASGIFNVKLKATDRAWQAYMRRTIAMLGALAVKGFAFNALTSYSDADHKRADLHYADPSYWFDHCKRAHSRFVTLVHDYPLYEFTLIVRR